MNNVAAKKPPARPVEPHLAKYFKSTKGKYEAKFVVAETLSYQRVRDIHYRATEHLLDHMFNLIDSPWDLNRFTPEEVCTKYPVLWTRLQLVVNKVVGTLLGHPDSTTLACQSTIGFEAFQSVVVMGSDHSGVWQDIFGYHPATKRVWAALNAKKSKNQLVRAFLAAVNDACKKEIIEENTNKQLFIEVELQRLRKEAKRLGYELTFTSI